MIVDAGHLFTDQKINLTYPSQLLTVLETLKRPLFILFIPSASDESPPDPAVNWRCSKEDAYEVVCREFGKGPTPRYLAVLEVGNKDEWTSPTNILKSRYKITTCPLLLRTQLTTLKPSTETGIQTVQFTQFDDIPHKLRFFRMLRVLIKGKDGKVEWKEITENKLPKGGKKLSFRENSLIAFGVGLLFFTYAHFQEEINPDSKWADAYRTFTREPLSWLSKNQPNVPMSSDHKPPGF